jgi:hypothetical protein
MLAKYAQRSVRALLVVAMLSPLSLSRAVAAPVAPAETTDAVVAARDFLQAVDYKAKTEAKITALAQTKVALQIMLEREPVLEDRVARLYAEYFTSDELREATKFHHSATGALYRDFNRDMNANPFTTPEIYRNEIAKHFTPAQRAEVSSYVSGGIGRKMFRMAPGLIKAEQKLGEQWGRETQEIINRAVRAGAQVS